MEPLKSRAEETCVWCQGQACALPADRKHTLRLRIDESYVDSNCEERPQRPLPIMGSWEASRDASIGEVNPMESPKYRRFLVAQPNVYLQRVNVSPDCMVSVRRCTGQAHSTQ